MTAHVALEAERRNRANFRQCLMIGDERSICGAIIKPYDP